MEANKDDSIEIYWKQMKLEIATRYAMRYKDRPLKKAIEYADKEIKRLRSKNKNK